MLPNSAEVFRIAIVGAGPAGLAAACRAAQAGVSHILLEASADIAHTIARYPKGKLVMAEPAWLPLQGDFPFCAATRESVLANWAEAVQRENIHFQSACVLTGLKGKQGQFCLSLADGRCVWAEHVVLALGVQGNIRRLGVAGEDSPCVQYHLDDPEQIVGECVLVVGGGDSGVENALALAARNRVILINRQAEFSNCKEANAARLKEALLAHELASRVSSSIEQLHTLPDGGLRVQLMTPSGRELIDCQRVIARLGAAPPRHLLEQLGLQFLSAAVDSAPVLSEGYESSIPGVFLIGALAGYPLIKQAINQGYEVVERILGRPVVPADEALLQLRLGVLPAFSGVNASLQQLKAALPLFRDLTLLVWRQLVSESRLLVPVSGEVIFTKGDYSDSFFSIAQGRVAVHVETRDGKAVFELAAGQFFGEMSLLSGRQRSATVIAQPDCILLETPRNAMLRLLDAVPAVQRKLDEIALKRMLRNSCGQKLAEAQLDELIASATMRRYFQGDVLFRQGDAPDGLYVIRRGAVTVSRLSAETGEEETLAYVPAGNYVGEMALVSRKPRMATVKAAAWTEAVLIEAARFEAVLSSNDAARQAVNQRYLERMRANETSPVADSGKLLQFLMDQGVGEATDVLLIDYSRCIRCDNCERACEETHGGSARLRRRAGQTYDMIHVPASCRHCENPRCMADCPVDAIHRSLNGEVVISDRCMGCGNCEKNCPYGVIQMTAPQSKPPRSLWEIFWGARQQGRPATSEAASRKAAKCDMCQGVIGGAACVRACPTGAAFRVQPEEFLSLCRKKEKA